MDEIWKIGSDNRNDKVILGPEVAAFHAELKSKDGRLIIRDLGSDKGTYVNDWRVRQKVIEADDNLYIGGKEIDINEVIQKKPRGERIVDSETKVKSNTLRNINPEMSDNGETKAVFWQNPKVLLGMCAILCILSVVGSYYTWSFFDLNKKHLVISEAQKSKYAFFEKNFRPRPVKIRNETGKDILIMAIIGTTYDSTSNGWKFKKPSEHSVSILVSKGDVKNITPEYNIENMVSVAFYIKAGDDHFVIDRPLAPQGPDFDSTANLIIIKMPPLR